MIRRPFLWACTGATPKDRANVSLTLACADGEWFPALVGGGSGESVGEWRTPWKTWGSEPWGLRRVLGAPSPLDAIVGDCPAGASAVAASVPGSSSRSNGDATHGGGCGGRSPVQHHLHVRVVSGDA